MPSMAIVARQLGSCLFQQRRRSGWCWGSSQMMVLCSRCRRSNMRTDPSAPTEANMSLPPPARLNAMSYTCRDKQLDSIKYSCAQTATQGSPLGYKHTNAHTSLSWAISWVFTCPDTRLTRPNTWPVSNPQIVQVVSILEVPAEKATQLNDFKGHKRKKNYIQFSNSTVYDILGYLPSRLGSTSFQSKEVRGAQKSEFLLLFSKHSRRVSVSLTCNTNPRTLTTSATS